MTKPKLRYEPNTACIQLTRFFIVNNFIFYRESHRHKLTRCLAVTSTSMLIIFFEAKIHFALENLNGRPLVLMLISV